MSDTPDSYTTNPGTGSLDPDAGGTYRGKPIWDLATIEANLNRTGYDWKHNNYGALDDNTLTFAFFKNVNQLNDSAYGVYDFAAGNARNFSAFNADQTVLAQHSIQLWNDLVAINFQQTNNALTANITYSNTYTGGAQAYAYLPFGDIYDSYYQQLYGADIHPDFGTAGGGVFIDNTVASNFFPTKASYYAQITMIHETGHALGLSHPGDYNALGPDGTVLSPTYANQAEYAQDSREYSLMSYFDAYETGAQHIDWALDNFAYASTPLVHDIATIQAIYGADPTTRTGNTTYGFHSNAARFEFDFTQNTRPIVAIYDAGGNDTLDFSGWNTPSIINLNGGSISSGGGADHFYTLDEVNAARAAAGLSARSQATYDYYEQLRDELGVTQPYFTDNIAIAYGTTIENAVGGGGNDTIIANDVANKIDGGAGIDTVSYQTAASAVQVSIANAVGFGTANAGHAGAAGDRLISIENLIGSNYDDILVGGTGANILDGGAGGDRLTGGGGSDMFVFHTNGSTGLDYISDFGSDDIIATDKAISGAASDGSVIVGTNGLVRLDTSDNDRLALTHVAKGTVLHFIGQVDGLYEYSIGSNVTPTATNIRLPDAGSMGGTEVGSLGAVDAKTAAAVAAASEGDSLIGGSPAATTTPDTTSTAGKIVEHLQAEDNVSHASASPAEFSTVSTGAFSDAADSVVKFYGGMLTMHGHDYIHTLLAA